MPTATGLPQKGERVTRLHPMSKVPLGSGTVVERGGGEYWSLTIKWDDGHVHVDVDAAYYWMIGDLRYEKES